jgi:hypothetical protein
MGRLEASRNAGQQPLTGTWGLGGAPFSGGRDMLPPRAGRFGWLDSEEGRDPAENALLQDLAGVVG